MQTFQMQNEKPFFGKLSPLPINNFERIKIFKQNRNSITI